MMVRCLFRVASNAEIIRGLLDTESGVVTTVPKELFTFSLHGDKWYKPKFSSIEKVKEIPYGVLERIMLANEDLIFVTNISSCSFYGQTKSEIKLFISEKSKGEVVYNISSDFGMMKEIGIKSTKRECYSIVPYQEKILLREEDGKIITSNGFMSLGNIQRESITEVPEDIDKGLLRELNLGAHFGIIWLDNKPMFVDRNINTLDLAK